MIGIIRACYDDPRHAAAIVQLMSHYACDPMGGGEPLSPSVLEGLVPALAGFPRALTLLASCGDDYVGLLNAFEGFSTFRCAPLLNVHDVVVLQGHRGKGIGRLLFDHAEAEARVRGCCKMTLEVLQGNGSGKRLYRKMGFAPYALDPQAGAAEFWQKYL